MKADSCCDIMKFTDLSVHWSGECEFHDVPNKCIRNKFSKQIYRRNILVKLLLQDITIWIFIHFEMKLSD